MLNPITTIILTFNEEDNIKACLESVLPISKQVFIVDSGSTDQTLSIAKQYQVKIIHHAFENYSLQRNWALKHLPIGTDWVLNVDADHRISQELTAELRIVFNQEIPIQTTGFLTSRRTIFMDRWIKYGGHYPTYHCVLFRKDFGYCEHKLYDQHFVVEGKLIQLKGDVIDILTSSLKTFTERHNKWSDLEAVDHFENLKLENVITPKRSGNPIEQRRYIKSMYERSPLFLRAFIYFFIRYFLRLGFLDGKEGLIFHTLQGLWFRLLIDAKIYELRKKHNLK
ncbi:glycosyltransferase family 2 protein [Pedobacter rhizosphaerae]|uniref:Glycosyltransferase involved in cell wall bisynthesis n=1 Tax=Pedobacter rhizosphaerae TaxID=390241 RepID=A0A1H9N662_9SPHI|nr:glycosyltransferase family 2 protein [Pedobacter rhizosphaerae]SER31301.1 Glycosyltransferase involved in cell wall bisynthesis [Pedobacter rhizosphaerae]